MDNQTPKYIANAHCRRSFQDKPFAWAAFFGWPISCNTWAGASPAGNARDGAGPMLTLANHDSGRRRAVNEAINDHLRNNDAEAHGENNCNRRHSVGDGCTQEVKICIRVVSELHESACHSEQEDSGHHRYYRGKTNGGEWHPPATRDWSKDPADQQTGNQDASRYSGTSLKSAPYHGISQQYDLNRTPQHTQLHR